MKRKTGYFERVGETLFSVYYDSYSELYSVRVKTDNVGFDDDREYFASDKEDADLTCKVMASSARELADNK